MKTLHFSLIVIAVFFLFLNLGQAHAYDDMYVQNIKVQPSAVKLGDTFTVTATLANNSTGPIWVEGGKCSVTDKQAEILTVTFDYHAKIKTKSGLFCAGVGWYQKLDPGQNFTTAAPDYTATFIATESGTANGKIRFSYHIFNLTDPTQPGYDGKISQPFQFAISNQSGSKPENAYGGSGTVARIALDPLQQFRSGMPIQNIKCGQDLRLVIKAEDESPACVKPDTAQILVERGWGHLTASTGTSAMNLENNCRRFSPAPGDQPGLRVTPVLLMKPNSTACARLTFTVVSNFKDCNGMHCSSLVRFNSTLHIGNVYHEKNNYGTGVTPAKDYTHSFKIKVAPETVDLANLPLGSKFTVTYIIRAMSNATGFYDSSVPKGICDSYPLAVGYSADEVSASNFTYINSAALPCPAGLYQLDGVEISGMNYTEVKLH